MAVEVVTFGCRLNAFESEVILREAERAGVAIGDAKLVVGAELRPAHAFVLVIVAPRVVGRTPSDLAATAPNVSGANSPARILRDRIVAHNDGEK